MGSKRFRRKADDKRTPLCPELIRAALGLGDMSVGGLLTAGRRSWPLLLLLQQQIFPLLACGDTSTMTSCQAVDATATASASVSLLVLAPGSVPPLSACYTLLTHTHTQS